MVTAMEAGFLASCECGAQAVYPTPGWGWRFLRAHDCGWADRLAAKRADHESRRGHRGWREEPPHGTYALAKRWGCLCLECTTAASYVKRANYKRLLQGRRSYVDAAPAREHLERLVSDGWTVAAVAAVCGVNRVSLYSVLDGRSAQMYARNAAAVLAVSGPPDRGETRASGWCDGTGTQRRLQALVAAGYPGTVLAAGLGMLPSNVTALMRRGRVRVSTASLVRALYADLERVPGPSSAARARGAREGWPPPLAWDEDTIDDPSAGPCDVVRSHRTSNRIQDLVEDVEWLVETGATWDSACARLEMRSESLERSLQRAGRHDLVRRLRRVA